MGRQSGPRDSPSPARVPPGTPGVRVLGCSPVSPSSALEPVRSADTASPVRPFRHLRRLCRRFAAAGRGRQAGGRARARPGRPAAERHPRSRCRYGRTARPSTRPWSSSSEPGTAARRDAWPARLNPPAAQPAVGFRRRARVLWHHRRPAREPGHGNNPRWLWETVACADAQVIHQHHWRASRAGAYPCTGAVRTRFQRRHQVLGLRFPAGELVVSAWGQDTLVHLVQANGNLHAVVGLNQGAFMQHWCGSFRKSF